MRLLIAAIFELAPKTSNILIFWKDRGDRDPCDHMENSDRKDRVVALSLLSLWNDPEGRPLKISTCSRLSSDMGKNQ